MVSATGTAGVQPFVHVVPLGLEHTSHEGLGVGSKSAACLARHRVVAHPLRIDAIRALRHDLRWTIRMVLRLKAKPGDSSLLLGDPPRHAKPGWWGPA